MSRRNKHARLNMMSLSHASGNESVGPADASAINGFVPREWD